MFQEHSEYINKVTTLLNSLPDAPEGYYLRVLLP